MTTGLDDDWQAKVKRVFIAPLILVNVAVFALGIINDWWGAVIASSGIFLLFGLIMLTRFRTLHAGPSLAITSAGMAFALTENVGSALAAAASLAMILVYVFWYSLNGRSPAASLAVGQPFPEIVLFDVDGNEVRSASWHGSPTILMFYRGNWCPLCTVQVKELAAGYRDIEALGAKVVLVSPQSADDSRKMASKFDAPMDFLVDEGNAAARLLDIHHPGGAPIGVAAVGETVLPTAVVIDRDGVVRFAHETDNYRVRPDPALFLEVLDCLTPAGSPS